jgi:hypothetical protein
LAQVFVAVIVFFMFLPWTSEAGDTVSGLEVGEGQFMVLVAVATIVLIRMGNRTSWITIGFAAAIMWRQVVVAVGGAGVVGIGLWLGTLAATIAVVLLVWNMFAEVRAKA